MMKSNKQPIILEAPFFPGARLEGCDLGTPLRMKGDCDARISA
jgi:hypothetical protein